MMLEGARDMSANNILNLVQRAKEFDVSKVLTIDSEGKPRKQSDVLLDIGPNIVTTKAFTDARSLPEACSSCVHVAACHGGCAGRRRLMGALGEPDPYCPIERGEDRRLSIRQAEAREMPKLESACTTIVIARS